MGKNVRTRFEHNANCCNVIQKGKPLFSIIKGRWNELYFQRPGEITLELGCGRGEYSVGLARIRPESHCIGVDIKGSRIYAGSKAAHNESLANIAFLRTKIQFLSAFFDQGEVSSIWLPFPDPRPRKRDVKRRLTSPAFLAIYHKILKSGGHLFLKTDHDALFQYSRDTLEKERGVEDIRWTNDLYGSDLLADNEGVVTKYEKMFLDKGLRINYLKCRFG